LNVTLRGTWKVLEIPHVPKIIGTKTQFPESLPVKRNVPFSLDEQPSQPGTLPSFVLLSCRVLLLGNGKAKALKYPSLQVPFWCECVCHLLWFDRGKLNRGGQHYIDVW
jgi:hypothetical protein